MYAIYGNINHPYTPNVCIYTSTMDPFWVYIYIHLNDPSLAASMSG